MSQDEVTQIRDGNFSIGIFELKAAIADVADEYGERPDRPVMEELSNRFCKRNYIPEIVNIYLRGG